MTAGRRYAEDYDHHRAFYGCLDWHSAVNSTWMMISLIKSDPNIAVAPAIRNEIEYHIQKSNIDGEMDFFTHLHGVGADFEKPYGYAWLLKLYGEMKTWDDPEGKRASTALEPMATWFAKAFGDYLKSLNYPVRVGLHPNTALDMGFVLDYTSETHDTALETIIHESAMRLFGNDKHCPTASEPVFGDFASPCLAEAALMGRVMSPEAYAKWLGEFLPPVYSDEFALYGKDIDAVHGNNRDTTGTDEEGLPNAHLVGLNFQRAADLMWISKSLPPSDPRVPAYRKLADINGKQGYDKIGLAGYLGTHWLATYALMYENLMGLSRRKTTRWRRAKRKNKLELESRQLGLDPSPAELAMLRTRATRLAMLDKPIVRRVYMRRLYRISSIYKRGQITESSRIYRELKQDIVTCTLEPGPVHFGTGDVSAL